jgi:hypothetical protein
VRFKLEFFKPFAATNSAEFAFKEEGGRTAVTWTMRGQNSFIGKAMCLFFDMDKMVGGDFEKGLAGIKQIVSEILSRRRHAIEPYLFFEIAATGAGVYRSARRQVKC